MPTISASPGLWDMGEASKVNKTQDFANIRGSYLGNDFNALANQARQPGANAQMGLLQQYQAQALGQGGPSVAQQQLAQQAQMQQAQTAAVGMRSRGGGLQGMGQQVGAAQQYGQQQYGAQQAQLQAAEQAQARAAAAQLGAQMYGQGFGYDQLGMQRTLGGDQSQLGWYAAQRGMDLQGDAAAKAFAMGIINAGAGFVGGVSGGAAQIANSPEEPR
jgi:hypothetical protein